MDVVDIQRVEEADGSDIEASLAADPHAVDIGDAVQEAGLGPPEAPTSKVAMTVDGKQIQMGKAHACKLAFGKLLQRNVGAAGSKSNDRTRRVMGVARYDLSCGGSSSSRSGSGGRVWTQIPSLGEYSVSRGDPVVVMIGGRARAADVGKVSDVEAGIGVIRSLKRVGERKQTWLSEAGYEDEGTDVYVQIVDVQLDVLGEVESDEMECVSWSEGYGYLPLKSIRFKGHRFVQRIRPQTWQDEEGNVSFKVPLRELQTCKTMFVAQIKEWDGEVLPPRRGRGAEGVALVPRVIGDCVLLKEAEPSGEHNPIIKCPIEGCRSYFYQSLVHHHLGGHHVLHPDSDMCGFCREEDDEGLGEGVEEDSGDSSGEGSGEDSDEEEDEKEDEEAKGAAAAQMVRKRRLAGQVELSAHTSRGRAVKAPRREIDIN